MNIAYIDVLGGVSGDMLLGALIDVGVDKNSLSSELKKIQPSGWKITSKKCRRGAITASSISFDINNSQKIYTWDDFDEKIIKSSLPNSDKSKIKGIFKIIETAEMKVHSEEKKKIHLHELGTLDTLLDVSGFVIGLRLLQVSQLYSSSFPIANGQFVNSHGAMSSTSLATAAIFLDYKVPIRNSYYMPPGEFVTPTGAAIVSYFVEKFKTITFIPTKVGYGAGDKNPDNYSNVTGIWLGKIDNLSEEKKSIVLLETNIDDTSGEIIGHVQKLILKKGCLDVWVTPIQMKKNRPGVLLSVLLDQSIESEIVEIIMRETTTLGIRRRFIDRHLASREKFSITTIFGEIQVKVKKINDEIIQINPEYDDCAIIASSKGIPLRQIYDLVIEETKKIIQIKSKD